MTAPRNEEAQPVATTPARRGAVILRTWRLFHVRGLAERVQQRRSAAPSRRLWAGPFCSSRRPSRSASHESGREGWERAGRVSWLAAHPAARRGGASAACARAFGVFWLPWVFCVVLRVRLLVLQAAWRGVGVSCLVWFWRRFGCARRFLTRVARVKSGNSRVKSGITGFFYCVFR